MDLVMKEMLILGKIHINGNFNIIDKNREKGI